MPWQDFDGRKPGEPRRWVDSPLPDPPTAVGQLTAGGGDRYVEKTKKVLLSPDQQEEVARERAEGYW